MVVNDDPYNRSLIDPLYQNTGYGTPQGQGMDVIGRGSTSGSEGGHGGVPLIPLAVSAWHLLSKLFHRPKATSQLPPTTPTTPTPPPTPEPPPTDPTAPKPPANSGSSIPKELLGAAPVIIALWQLLQKNDPTANNPAQGALNAAVPQLTAQLNDLLQNDVRRRQMSDPLYEAVLRGAMGGLPVWMRGSGLGPLGAALAPRTPGSGVPVTPATGPFRSQGDDADGYAFPNVAPRG